MKPAGTIETARRGFGLSLTRLAWFIPLTAVLLPLRLPIKDNSYLWHIRAGELQIDAGSVLTSDPFTFTALGEPWRTQSWLMDLVYGWSERLSPLVSAGPTVVVSALVMLGAIALRLGRRRIGLLAPLGVLWVMWITLGYFTARPVFPSLALLAVLVLVLDDARLRWCVPLVFWIWASIHGGFIVGLGYLVVQSLRTRERRHVATIVASLAAVSVTAHGWAIWEILLRFGEASENLNLILEWRPPDFISIPLFPFLLGILALLLGAMKSRLTYSDLWVIVPFLGFAFTANRAVPMAAIVLVGFVVPATAPTRLGSAPLAWPVAVVALVTILLIPVLIPVESDGLEDRFPVEAATHLSAEPVFHDDGVGGYLIYRGSPAGVFIDDRAELFGSLYAEALSARDAEPGWEGLFDRYSIGQALLKHTDAVVEVLRAQGWEEIFSDDDHVLLHAPE